MGVGLNKDPNVSLGLQLQKTIISAGEKLDGRAFLFIKKECIFDSLVLKLIGEQKRNANIFASKNQLFYEDELQLTTFQNSKIEPGNYQIPFSIILPQQLPGCYSCDRKGPNKQTADCQLKYTLLLSLVCLQYPSQTQCYQYLVNINQKPQKYDANQIIQEYLSGRSKICCCLGTGIINMKIKAKKRCFQKNEIINLQTIIDHRKSSRSIQEIQYYLIQNHVKQAQTVVNGKQFDHYAYQTNLKTISQFSRNIEGYSPGGIENFPIELITPENLKYSSVNGIKTAVWYEIGVKVKMSLKSQLPLICIPIFLSYSYPHFENQEISIFRKPKNWDPIIYPRVCYSLKSYQYRPSKCISKLQLKYVKRKQFRLKISDIQSNQDDPYKSKFYQAQHNYFDTNNGINKASKKYHKDIQNQQEGNVSMVQFVQNQQLDSLEVIKNRESRENQYLQQELCNSKEFIQL